MVTKTKKKVSKTKPKKVAKPKEIKKIPIKRLANKKENTTWTIASSTQRRGQLRAMLLDHSMIPKKVFLGVHKKFEGCQKK